MIRRATPPVRWCRIYRFDGPRWRRNLGGRLGVSGERRCVCRRIKAHVAKEPPMRRAMTCIFVMIAVPGSRAADPPDLTPLTGPQVQLPAPTQVEPMAGL